ncbi:MAG: response regulator [Spirochaetes bacterium]|nr:response regulator [Spirochaetota bacterium]
MEKRKPVSILIAEDDSEDRILIQEAFHESRLANDIKFVADGEELLDYLRHTGKYHGDKSATRPGIILLDLNMPKKDGRETLRDLKADPLLATIPVIILTTSQAEEDIVKSYKTGASGFITKPVTFDGLVNVMRIIGKYWFEIVELPGPRS